MRIGRLRDRITIRRLTDAPNGRGGFTRSWTTIAADLPAEVLSQTGSESVRAAALQGIEVYRITVRYREDVHHSDQVEWRDQELNIRAAVDPDGKRKMLSITADNETPQEAI